MSCNCKVSNHINWCFENNFFPIIRKGTAFSYVLFNLSDPNGSRLVSESLPFFADFSALYQFGVIQMIKDGFTNVRKPLKNVLHCNLILFSYKENIKGVMHFGKVVKNCKHSQVSPKIYHH